MAVSKLKRSCGDCNACCTVLRIDSQLGYSTRLDNGEDIAKPAGVSCRFLTKNGCGIYAVRPIVCRSFKCDWLKGRKGHSYEAHPLRVGFFSIDNDRFFVEL